MSAGHPHVVLGFSAADRFAADTVKAALEDSGLACIVAPDDATDAAGIAAALAAALALVIVHSRATGADMAVLRAVEAATGRRLPLVVVRLDAAKPSPGLATFLRKVAAFDAADGTLPARLTALTTRVRRVAGLVPTTAEEVDDGAGGIDLWAVERRHVHRGWWVAGALIVAGIAVLGWRAHERQAADQAYERGVARLASGDVNAAVLEFDAALARRPAWGAAWRQRGFAVADPRVQIGDFTRAIEIDAADADALAGRARAYAQLGDYRRAAADFGAALARAPDIAPWYGERALVLLLLGEEAAAAADLTRCRQLDPRCADTFAPRIVTIETALNRPPRDWFAAQ
jgi:tetratricopeptide (TPR) repeat protein